MYQDQVALQTLRLEPSLEINTGASLEPIKELQDDSEHDTQSESDHGTPKPWNGPQPLADIEFRIKELYNRHYLLMKMQLFRKKKEGNHVWTNEGMASMNQSTEMLTCEDSDQMCELEAIQIELEEMLVKKKELEKQGNCFKLITNEGQQGTYPTYNKTEIPHGGIYMLPPPQLSQEDFTLAPRVKTRPVTETGSEIPVDILGQTPALTKCPSCEEVVFTETRSRVGETAWMVCLLCTMIGCVAGCCFIPFCMNRLKNVHHQCPQCQAHIHTHKLI